ncbi:YrbG protein [Gracilibacillus halophilus YIM-C55.5]|uniref:YrbG protein n=1 Tax=Gracilibacillus halophilus YIM-C55.5 TaxID=1308866 RepID=N4WVK5_9BACI|nr:DUF421 domain-containing protein [Gracilibacillus halophilus]ENH97096.1 YrbG protein [Gracilibacillus halophilus YIM-C55.5]
MSFEESLLLIVRTLFSYVVIIVTFRLMGKREIGELSLLDMVVFIMIAEVAVISIEDLEQFFAYGVIPMTVLLLIQRLTAWLSLKSPKFRAWFDGKPSIIITQGKIDEYEMKKNRLNFDDLLQQLRENGTESINDVDYAILEASGKLSIIEKDQDHSIGNHIDGLVLPLVVDGRIQDQALEQLGKDSTWLIQQIKQRGYPEPKYLSFCSIDANNQWYIDIKNERGWDKTK